MFRSTSSRLLPPSLCSTIASAGGWLCSCFSVQPLCFTVETFSLVTRVRHSWNQRGCCLSLPVLAKLQEACTVWSRSFKQSEYLSEYLVVRYCFTAADCEIDSFGLFPFGRSCSDISCQIPILPLPKSSGDLTSWTGHWIFPVCVIETD